MKYLVMALLTLSFSLSAKQKSISHSNFDEVISVVENIYLHEFNNQNAMLLIDGNWESDITNAFASRPRQYVWQVDLHGALGRESLMSSDTFALVLCHEIGHHIGGIPKDSLSEWASAEGQADYFAAARCMKKVLDSDAARYWSTDPVTDDVKKLCANTYPQPENQRICERTITAGKTFTEILAPFMDKTVPSINSPDPLQVEYTNTDTYPSLQCRLDTIIAGSLCNNDIAILPDSFDHNIGYCSTGVGMRPACWFNTEQPW